MGVPHIRKQNPGLLIDWKKPSQYWLAQGFQIIWCNLMLLCIDFFYQVIQIPHFLLFFKLCTITSPVSLRDTEMVAKKPKKDYFLWYPKSTRLFLWMKILQSIGSVIPHPHFPMLRLFPQGKQVLNGSSCPVLLPRGYPCPERLPTFTDYIHGKYPQVENTHCRMWENSYGRVIHYIQAWI